MHEPAALFLSQLGSLLFGTALPWQWSNMLHDWKGKGAWEEKKERENRLAQICKWGPEICQKIYRSRGEVYLEVLHGMPCKALLSVSLLALISLLVFGACCWGVPLTHFSWYLKWRWCDLLRGRCSSPASVALSIYSAAVLHVLRILKDLYFVLNRHFYLSSLLIQVWNQGYVLEWAR